ncbi:hypothetical protein WR25_10715 [Diploscapter pachys]|uniref:Helicase ATP-binding domain-containing protein n=1 Tax=Diploscapter pachys TaxID=2018661 RepID=A0A2A2KAB5_9BILA|nr:hypothetical protein WR25_10715 [Diploscapter pachys]
MPPRATLYWLEKFGTSQIPSDLSELIPQEMLDRLFDYQKDGVRFILEREGRALIADESGLGKTWQALTAMMAYKVDWPVLIVCPSSAKHVWQKEITKLLPEDEDRKVMTINRYDDELPEEDEENVIVIMSYGIMTRKLNELLEIPFKIVIFDESHKLKERKTQRSQAAIKIADAAERVILLSATPALSRPNELWMQLRLIDDRVYPKFKQFGDRYCEGYYNTDLEYYDSRGCSHHKELRTILYSRFTIRRTKAKELADLPSKKRELIYLSNELIDYTERRLLEARREYIQYLLDCEANERDINVYHASVTDYYTQTGIAKASAVSNYIVETYFGEAAEEENKGKKLLVFAYHLDVLDAIQEENEPEIRVALLSLITGGFALNLTAATSVIFAELYWNPTYHEQAEDRAHRIGQTERVECKYLMSEDTADEMVWSSIEAKLVVLGKV